MGMLITLYLIMYNLADLMLCKLDSGKEYKNLHTIEVHTKLRGQGSGNEGANEQNETLTCIKKYT